MQIKFQHFFYVQWVYYHKTAAMLDKFRLWFEKFDAELWDKQFEDDVRSGKLDQLADQALKDFEERLGPGGSGALFL